MSTRNGTGPKDYGPEKQERYEALLKQLNAIDACVRTLTEARRVMLEDPHKWAEPAADDVAIVAYTLNDQVVPILRAWADLVLAEEQAAP